MKYLFVLLAQLLFVASLLNAEKRVAVEDLSDSQYQSYLSIENSVLSPYCPGRLLRDCPSGAASILKAEIRQEIVGGKSESEIVESLYQRFGEEIRGAPSPEGFGLVAWIMPIVFVLLGLVLLLTWGARARAATSTPAENPPSGTTGSISNTDEEKRVQEELDKF